MHLPENVKNRADKAIGRVEANKKYPEGRHTVFQHVDDLTQIMWSKKESELASRGYDSVRMWAKEVRRVLHMQCSDKTSSSRKDSQREWCSGLFSRM